MRSLRFANTPFYLRKEKRIETKIYKENGISTS